MPWRGRQAPFNCKNNKGSVAVAMSLFVVFGVLKDSSVTTMQQKLIQTHC